MIIAFQNCNPRMPNQPYTEWSFSGFVIDGGCGAPTYSQKSVTYPTMMKLDTVIPYLKKIQKKLNHVIHRLKFADISIFLPEISKFCYIKKYRYLYNHFHNILRLFDVLPNFRFTSSETMCDYYS